MAEYYLPGITITKETRDEDIRRLIKIIKPSWNIDQLISQVLSNNQHCRIFRCFDRKTPDDVVVIKIGHLFQLLTSDLVNENELRMIQYLSGTGHFPKIHAIFSNGYCYQFINGNPLINFKSNKISMDDDNLRTIANELAYIHSLKFEGVKYRHENCFQLLKSIITKIPADSKLTAKTLSAEIEMITTYLKENYTDVTICHGNMNLANVIWNKEEGKVTFIDWEAAGFGYPLMDVAYFLYGLHNLENCFNNNSENIFIPPDYDKKFVRYYIESFRVLQYNNKTVTEQEVMDCLKEIEFLTLEPLLIFISFGLTGFNSFDSCQGIEKQSVEKNIRNYLKLKNKLFGKETFEISY